MFAYFAFQGAQGECVVQAAGWRCSLLSDAARRHCYRLPASDASEANPIVKCDGEHETEVGTHLECMDPPLDGGVPEDAWFCVECQQNSVYQVKAVVAKDPRMKRLVNGHRTGKACVHYKIEWAGQQWMGHDTWEALESLQQPRVKEMVSAFNKRARRV